jgi:hypothetical protein
MAAFSGEEHMPEVHVLAIDLAKRSFQVCGTDRGGAVLFNRPVSRTKLEGSINLPTATQNQRLIGSIGGLIEMSNWFSC